MKKPTVKQLTADVSRLDDALRLTQHQFRVLNNDYATLKKKHAERIDQTMMDSRIKLASNLGQMMEAFTRAVGFIIAKEVL